MSSLVSQFQKFGTSGGAEISIALFFQQMTLVYMQRRQHLKVLFLCALCTLLLPVSHSRSMMQMCGMDDEWICNKNVEKVPRKVAQICEICGYYWGNVPGLGYCCRCSPKVFDFCVIAVLG